MRHVFSLLYTLVLMAAMWRCFQKMGRMGWEGIIPGYRFYVLFDMIYQNGWKVFLLLIPFYNIYVMIKLCMELAPRFHKARAFGVGMALLAPVFWSILAFGPAKYLNGNQAIKGEDAISQFLAKIAGEK